MEKKWTLMLMLVLLVGRSVQQNESCPPGCKCNDININCSGMKLRTFPDGINPGVQELDLSDNNIHEFPSSMKQFAKLRTLDLSNNRISSLGNATLQGLISLEDLDLSFNKFPSIDAIKPNESFAHLPKLKRLKLVNNTLKEFSKFASSSLEELDVSGCSISKISEISTLSMLGNLRILNASHNPLAWVWNLKSSTLTTLDISHANLDSIANIAVAGLPSLHTIHMGYNDKLNYYLILQSTSLVVLDARYCSINYPKLTGMPNLERVIYHRNDIVSIRKEDFINSTRVKHLDLSLNKISSLETDVFAYLTSLEYLNIAHNAIKSIAWNSFVANYKLKVLDLSRNNIDKLVNFSSNSLTELDFSHCELKLIDKEALGGLPMLQKLNISGNLVKHLPVRFYSHSLRSLDASYCRLLTVSNETFIEMSNLKELHLHGNSLVSVPRSSLLKQLRLKYISLYDNAWRCECDDEDFKYFWTNLTDVVPPLMTPKDTGNLICVSPKSVESKSWLSACRELWYPFPSSGSMFNRYGTAILICLICAGGCFLLVTVLRQSLQQRKKKRHARRARRTSEAQAIQERMRVQHLEALLQQEHDRITNQSPANGRHVRSPSQITQPPTYEEAVEMARSMERLEIHTSEPEARGSRTPQVGVENSRKKTEKQSRRESQSSSESGQEEAVELGNDQSALPVENQDYDEDSISSDRTHSGNGST